jgi:iron(III) transport system substrate-binding protein
MPYLLQRTLVTAASLAALAALFAGCGGEREALTIYSGRSESLVGPLLERFAEQAELDVDVRYGDSSDLALLLSEEGERTRADVFLSQSPGAVGYVAERGLLAELPAGLLARVDRAFVSGERRWVGVTGRQRVLVYNEELVDEAELPRSVWELTEPRYRGRVAVAPGNASFQDFVSALRQAEGDERTGEFLRGLAENGARSYANNNAIVEAVGRGEVPLGLVNHYYNERFLDEDPDLPSRNYVFPDGDLGSLVLPSTVSILEGADRSAEAERFVEFLLSPEAQRYFREETFEYPLAAGDEAGELAASAGEAYDIDRLGGELEETARLIAESGLRE